MNFQRQDPATVKASKEYMKGKGSQYRAPTISAIFVHAGAGYHSTTNEQVHLGACNDAAKMAMRMLKAGASAVDAVEAAIKVLEDKEITNAGFGSNLSIDGVVECDATIVDHLGRSGACGATAQIRNPIHLARIILNHSNQPLSLRRVPPNLLVGDGATEFAYQTGIPILPHDAIVSKNARDRYIRWKEDLRRAERELSNGYTPSSRSPATSSLAEEDINHTYEQEFHSKQRRDHTHALLNSTWNEGQPDSPAPQSPGPVATVDYLLEGSQNSPKPPSHGLQSPSTPIAGRSYRDAAACNTHSQTSSPSLPNPKRARYSQQSSDAAQSLTHGLQEKSLAGISSSIEDASTFTTLQKGDGADSPQVQSRTARTQSIKSGKQGDCGETDRIKDQDIITDTVGAIAIDIYGNIAAASSSGGIGMKHRGRVGPAALVGVGTAVIPIDMADPDKVTVAVVTSGTGEHMATTMASQKCAERLYQCTRRGQGGIDIEATEEEAIESFVAADFMQHPGVVHSNSQGAIGVMAVKKTPRGYYLHFAHNTDSFALASMHSMEQAPQCVMSRTTELGGPVVRGARKIRTA
ncbi:N-terminal nucleophile aminohydrolases-1 [Coleophoma crateriformis]|uniref:N-terminal nucleophile aminohydrolases-1 n=1 Tax=Coleophoma crateriformis TaxID=565419 RepID=A0A3D8RDN1_9HELO|nr:N-terminal nucleophile aminohydrolases-1 [Coleophoma crateriformis]